MEQVQMTKEEQDLMLKAMDAMITQMEADTKLMRQQYNDLKRALGVESKAE